MRQYIFLSVLVTVLGGVSLAMTMPPRPPDVRIVAPPGIPAVPYETAKHSKFEPVFTRVNWAPIRPYAIVVDNPTGKAVLGLAIRWTYTNASGPGEWNFILDSFFGGALATSPAHTPVLVVPGAAMSAAYVNTPALFPRRWFTY